MKHALGALAALSILAGVGVVSVVRLPDAPPMTASAARHVPTPVAPTAPDPHPARLRFRVQAPSAPSMRLWIAPDSEAAPDATWEAVTLDDAGEAEVWRTATSTPVRWVLHDAQARARASGAVHPGVGDTREVSILPHPPHSPEATGPARSAADGRRRVVLALLDGAAWNVVSYLRLRGELPVLDGLLTHGARAVLASEPPSHAAALDALRWPARHTDASPLGQLYLLGSEVGARGGADANRLEPLSWLLPESDGLFETLTRAGLDATDLLGDASPRGVREALRLLDRGDADFVALRLASIGRLPPAALTAAQHAGQDDGAGQLFDAVREADRDLGRLEGALDGDDVLIAMSDHALGAASPRDAFFVAAGAGVQAGRISGRPTPRDVARAVAAWLGVATSWSGVGVLAVTPATPPRAAR